MKLLALETATDACSVALWVDGAISERYQVAPRQHAQRILPMCEAVLNEADLSLSQLDALAFGRGPGSFTGLRIAAGVVQGLALGTGLPVVPVSTLAALAVQAFTTHDAGYAFAALDARMGEVYWGVYQRDADGLAHVSDAEAVTQADQVLCPAMASGVGIGSGWAAYETVLKQRLGAECVQTILPGAYPRAVDELELAVRDFQQGKAVSAEQALPVYLRNQVARKPG